MLSEKSLVGGKNSVLRWDGEEVEDGSGGGVWDNTPKKLFNRSKTGASG